MPAIFRPDLLIDLSKALETVGQGARKVEGDGYKVYRIGATIRIDITPHWVSGPGPELEGKEEQKEPDWGGD